MEVLEMKKSPTTVRIKNPKTAEALRQIKKQTGVAIEFLVDELLVLGLKAKKF